MPARAPALAPGYRRVLQDAGVPLPAIEAFAAAGVTLRDLVTRPEAELAVRLRTALAAEAGEGPWLVAVQWHPERMLEADARGASYDLR